MRESGQQAVDRTRHQDGPDPLRPGPGQDYASRDATGDAAVSPGNPLVKAMLDNFRDPCLEKMLERLDSVLTESTSYSRNSAMMRHQVHQSAHTHARLLACLLRYTPCIDFYEFDSPPWFVTLEMGRGQMW